jgi:hypothetical protein
MSELDERIRGLVANLLEASPAPPAFPAKLRTKRRSRKMMALAVTVAIAAAVGIAALSVRLDHHGGQTVAVGAPSPKPRSGPATPRAFVYLRPVLCLIPAYAATTSASGSTNPSPTGTAVPLASPDSLSQAQADCAASNEAELPTTRAGQDLNFAYAILPYYHNSVRYIVGPADMTGSIAHVAVQATPTGQYTLLLTFTAAGSSKFNLIAAQRHLYYQHDASNYASNYASLEAFDVDGVVESAPAIQAASFNGTVVISGSPTAPFTRQHANDVAAEIRAATSH